MTTTTAVVTGAGRGLGRLVAERLAIRGHQVILTDIDAEAAKAAAREVGRGAIAITQDVRDPASHRRVADEARQRGPLAVWINNAGVLVAGTAWETSDTEVRREVEVNFLGVVWGCRAAIDAMSNHGGHIVNLASMSSLVPTPGLAVYGATKHAVLGYTLSLAGDLHRAGVPIRVTAVCPDAIETDMVSGVAHDEASSILFTSRKLLSPKDVADQIVDVLDHPRLVRAIPAHRAAMAHVLRPFPAVGLRIMEQLARVGSRHRRKRGATA